MTLDKTRCEGCPPDDILGPLEPPWNLADVEGFDAGHGHGPPTVCHIPFREPGQPFDIWETWNPAGGTSKARLKFLFDNIGKGYILAGVDADSDPLAQCLTLRFEGATVTAAVVEYPTRRRRRWLWPASWFFVGFGLGLLADVLFF